jgi:O-antigen/teichoic acid export membrane protein
VWLLLVGYVVNIALGLNSGALAAAGNRRALFRYGTAGFATMIVLACALIPPFGPTGAAIATSATFVVINVVLAVALARSAGILPLRTDLAVTVASSALPVTAVLALRAWGHPTGTAAAIGVSLALWAAWLPLLVALRALRLTELTRLVPRRTL